MKLGPYFEEGGATGVAPAVAPAPAIPATPAAPARDEIGRFSKANIDKAIGGAEPPAVPHGTTPAVPATPAAAPAAVAPTDINGALERFIAANPDPVTPMAPAAAQPAQPQTPQTPELMQVQQWLSNPQQAAEAVAHTRIVAGLNQALNRGDIDGALANFAPGAVDAIKEHFFQKHRDEFSQRIIDESNGIKRDPTISLLQQQYAELRSQWDEQRNQQTAQQQYQQQQQAQAATSQRLRTYTDGLFDTAGLKDSPYRGWIEGRMAMELGQDPAAVAQIRAGKYGPIVSKFRELYTQFQPFLTAAALPAQAAQPGSTQLMTAAAGPSTAAQPQTASPLLRTDGTRGINGSGVVARLRDVLRKQA